MPIVKLQSEFLDIAVFVRIDWCSCRVLWSMFPPFITTNVSFLSFVQSLLLFLTANWLTICHSLWKYSITRCWILENQNSRIEVFRVEILTKWWHVYFAVRSFQWKPILKPNLHKMPLLTDFLFEAYSYCLTLETHHLQKWQTKMCLVSQWMLGVNERTVIYRTHCENFSKFCPKQ